MHYFEDPQTRERRLVDDVAQYHWGEIARILSLRARHRVFPHLDKRVYGAIGDVDIAVWDLPEATDQTLIAVEVKTLHLTRGGELKSRKPFKHHKQLRNLMSEGWDYIWLMDFIVTEPAPSWLHPQSFDGFDQYSKGVAAGCGHAVVQINAVEGRPEAEAGSIAPLVLAAPARVQLAEEREHLLAALRRLNQPAGGI